MNLTEFNEYGSIIHHYSDFKTLPITNYLPET